MRVLNRCAALAPVPLPLAVSGLLAVVLLVTMALARPDGGGGPPGPRPATGAPAAAQPADAAARPASATPIARSGRGGWSGLAFDACRAPSQRTMDRWRRSSPFTGVGIYIGGVHRACGQRHLSATWVTRQLRSGWRLLPIWVGPQASCTGYRHRISPRPGAARRYHTARARGRFEARRAARAARTLQVPRGELIFYDIEPFDVHRRDCRGSTLALLDAWTREVRRHGYRSGVYSHVRAGIALLSRTGRGYARPDAVWYAHVDRVGTMPAEHVGTPAFMRSSRVHQYALDTRVEFGGIRMAIDWNFVSLGAVRPVPSPVGCGELATRVRPARVRQGERGPHVRALQCLVLPGRPHPLKTSGRVDRATLRALHGFQRQRGLTVTTSLDRRTWTALIARGSTPVLRKGARGESVRRLQRSLNVAAGRTVVRVDGAYGRNTARVVRHYRVRLGLGSEGTAGPAVWRALSRGKVLPARRP